MYVHITSGAKISDSDYIKLKLSNRRNFVKGVESIPPKGPSERVITHTRTITKYVPQRERRSSSDGLLTSGIIGAVTNNAILGTVLGGSLLGGILGDVLGDGDLF
jgi:hypothetical protein